MVDFDVYRISLGQAQDILRPRPIWSALPQVRVVLRVFSGHSDIPGHLLDAEWCKSRNKSMLTFVGPSDSSRHLEIKPSVYIV